MSYSVRYTKTAADDLNEAVDYIDHVLQNPSAADALLRDLEKELEHLAAFPASHAVVDDPFLKAQKIRYAVIDHYLAFYIMDDTGHIVHIIRFLYGKRDWISILKSGFSLS